MSVHPDVTVRFCPVVNSCDRRSESVLVTPMFGFRHELLERTVSSMDKGAKRTDMTLYANLGNFQNRRFEKFATFYLAEPEENREKKIGTLVTLLQDDALPFARAQVDITVLAATLWDWNLLEVRTIVALHLANRPDEAYLILRDYERKRGEATKLWEFIGRVRPEVATDSRAMEAVPAPRPETPSRGGTHIWIRKDQLIFHLRSYGEEELALRVASEWSNRLAESIGRLAPAKMTLQDRLIAKAVALAAVEVLEGHPRELKRKRRKFVGEWPQS